MNLLIIPSAFFLFSLPFSLSFSLSSPSLSSPSFSLSLSLSLSSPPCVYLPNQVNQSVTRFEAGHYVTPEERFDLLKAVAMGLSLMDGSDVRDAKVW